MRLITDKNGKKRKAGRKHHLQKIYFLERCAMFLYRGRNEEVENSISSLTLKELKWCLDVVREELLPTLNTEYTIYLEKIILQNLRKKLRDNNLDKLNLS
jgi:hypothetical protein